MDPNLKLAIALPLLLLPYPFLIRKKYPFTVGLTEFFSRRMAKPSLELTRYGDFLHYNRVALTTRPRRLSGSERRGIGSAFHQLCPRYSGTPLPLRLIGYGKPLPYPITLRYLATADRYKTLMYGFRVAHNVISLVVHDFCQAINKE